MLKFRAPFLSRIKFNKNQKSNWRVKLFFKLLNNIKYGQLKLITPELETYKFLGSKDSSIVNANLNLNCWDPLIATFSKGDVGFGEAFMGGQWSSSNLTDLFHTKTLTFKHH